MDGLVGISSSIEKGYFKIDVIKNRRLLTNLRKVIVNDCKRNLRGGLKKISNRA